MSIRISPFVGGNGNRSNIRQQEDEGLGNFIDQYSPVLIGAIVAVILVWVGNALLKYMVLLPISWRRPDRFSV